MLDGLGAPAIARSAAFTSEDDQAEAPLGVPQRASSQQDLIVVQPVGLSIGDQVPLELVQAVVRGLAPDLTCQRSLASTSAHLEVRSGTASCDLSPLNLARRSVTSPISPVTVRACFTFRLVSLQHKAASSAYHDAMSGGRGRASASAGRLTRPARLFPRRPD